MNELADAKDSYTGLMDIKSAFIGSIPGDAPLLEELGIDMNSIKLECLLPIKAFQKNQILQKASDDLTGPLIILFAFTFTLVLQGKIHFGYIYLISLMSSFVIFSLLNLMSNKAIGYLMICNVMGYSMTPVVTFSFVNIVSKWLGLNIRILLGAIGAFWSAFTASKMFCIHLEFVDRQAIVLYPLFLAYCCFVMMILF